MSRRTNVAAFVGHGDPTLQAAFVGHGGPTLRTARCLLGCLSVLLFAAAGCRKEPAPEPDLVRSVAERGALKFTVEARPKQAWLGDPIQVALNFHTPEDCLVQLPTASDFGDLKARVVDEPDPRPGPDGGLDWRRTFVVETFSSGTLEIPPLVAKYVREPTGATTQPIFENELVTDTLKIEVRSALTTQDSPDHPRDITGTLLPPKPRQLWPWLVLVGGLLVAAVAAYVLVRFLRGRGLRAAPPIAPEVWALRMLAQLRADEVETDGAREFYYQLSEIVRAYIEKKFALAAPEMTTEEFLVKLARDQTALPYDTDRLRAFLEACDIVKYAAYRPRRADAEQGLGTARAFVNETAAAAATRANHPLATHRPEAGATNGGATEAGATEPGATQAPVIIAGGTQDDDATPGGPAA
jgi:hypothetical protein